MQLEKILLRHKLNLSTKDAFIFEDVNISYADLPDIIERYKEYLIRQGVGENSVVGISIADELRHILLSISLICLGARQTTLATYEGELIHKSIIDDLEISHIIFEENFSNKYFQPNFFIKKIIDPKKSKLPSPQGSIFLRSSGTMGLYKTMVFSEDLIVGQSTRHADYSAERFIRLATVEHATSKRHRLYCLINGGTNIFRPSTLNIELVPYLLTKGVTCLDLSRMHISNFLHISKTGLLKKIKFRPGGAPVPWSLRDKIINNISPQLHIRYAATECGTISITDINDHDQNESAGSILEGVELQIVDANDQVLPALTTGKIRVKTSGMITEYLNAPEATRKSFKDGWFYTGDIGYVNIKKKLFVIGRSDEMLIFNGINIFPAQVERILDNHPDIAASAVIGISSSIHGTIPVAVIEPHPGHNLSENMFKAFLKAQLGLIYPRKIFFLETLPRNSEGKIDKIEIKKMLNKI